MQEDIEAKRPAQLSTIRGELERMSDWELDRGLALAGLIPLCLVVYSVVRTFGRFPSL
jgi:hypothetical protein